MQRFYREVRPMGKFLNGLCIGIGIGLFIAPQPGQETRRMIMERAAALRKSMVSEDDQNVSIKTYPSPMTTFPLPPVPPVTVPASEPQEQATSSTLPAQTDIVSAIEPQKQIITDVSTTDIPSTTRTDTENTEKLPTLSSPTNMPIRSAKRKASTRTSSTSKARGHSRS